MSEQHKQWIGIDICSNYLDIAIHPQGKTFRLANDDTGQAELVHRLSSYQVEGIVLEATGGIERDVMSAELGQRTAKQIAALVGVAPFNRDSGKFRGQRRIQGGRKELRSLLYMAAMCAVQHNSVFRDHYAQLLDSW